MLKRIFIVTIALMAFAVVLPIVTAQEPLTATVNEDVNVRSQPDIDSSRVTVLLGFSEVNVLGRNDSATWAFVETPDGSAQGWVAFNYLSLSRAIRITDLPVMTPGGEMQTVAEPEAEADAENTLGIAADGDPEAPSNPIVEENTDHPLYYLDGAVQANVRRIHARGQELGVNYNAFMKIGESNTAGTVFLCPFAFGNYDLGGYDHLQTVVDLFNQSGSFCHFNETAQNGFSTSNVLDSTWADPNKCQPNETPLQCEYRLRMPGYAVIYMGIGDMGRVSEERYQENMGEIITFLSNNGVIPILSTFSMSDKFADGNPQIYNQLTRDIARRYNVPLIDVRVALFDYTDRGTGPDGYHLSVRDNEETTFTGDEFVYGRTRRELMTLQMLFDLNALLNS